MKSWEVYLELEAAGEIVYSAPKGLVSAARSAIDRPRNCSKKLTVRTFGLMSFASPGITAGLDPRHHPSGNSFFFVHGGPGGGSPTHAPISLSRGAVFRKFRNFCSVLHSRTILATYAGVYP
jgi:hypothetical protein